jgi:hypothetical protein
MIFSSLIYLYFEVRTVSRERAGFNLELSHISGKRIILSTFTRPLTPDGSDLKYYGFFVPENVIAPCGVSIVPLI